MAINRERLAIVAGFVLLLALLAGPVWQLRQQPLFGDGYDDALYFSGAKALASGDGYRMLSFPGQPWEVKYPPLYPLYLSLAWRVQPSFPANLSIASALQAALLPIFVLLLLLTLRSLGFVWRKAFLLAGLMLSSLAFVQLSTTLFSEILFLCFLLASILAIERAIESPRAYLWAATGGLLAGAAYLTRTAGLPLLIAVPIFCFLRRRARLALIFLACSLPAAAAWHFWTSAHAASGDVSYVQEYLRIIRANGFFANILTQIAALAGAAAEDFLTGIADLLHGIPIYPILLVAALAGLIRLSRRLHWRLLAIFTFLYLPMLVCWWYHDLMRLILPAWPALLAGIAEEAEHFASLVRGSLARQRFRWALATLAIIVVISNQHAAWTFVRLTIIERQAQQPPQQQAFAWIRAHAEPDDVLLAWKDGLSWFYTGVPASRLLFASATQSTPLMSTPPQYHRGLLLLMTSELSGGDERSRLLTLEHLGSSVPGAHLAYSSSAALIYTVPLARSELSALLAPRAPAHP